MLHSHTNDVGAIKKNTFANTTRIIKRIKAALIKETNLSVVCQKSKEFQYSDWKR